jgi:transcriptional regulator with XRE-family HTH domain
MMYEETKEAARRIGARLQKARVARRHDQVSLAAISGISAAKLARYESGDGGMTVVELEQLAVHLQVPLRYFFDGCTVCGNVEPD